MTRLSGKREIIVLGAEDDDGKTFLLDDEKMAALSRFLWIGKLLPTDRDTYIRDLGLTDTSEMSDKVWGEVDSLLGTYTEVCLVSNLHVIQYWLLDD
jgi:hypothetical protein